MFFLKNVTDFSYMFYRASSFNQDLSMWQFNNNMDHLYETLGESGLDVDNYDAILQRFVDLGITNKALGATALFYCDEIAHDQLTDYLGWTIYDDSLHDDCTMTADEFKSIPWKMYPNPTSSYLRISYDAPMERAVVSDLQGNLLISLDLRTNPNRNAAIDFSQLSVGLYFVTITSSGIKQTNKFKKE